MANKSDESKRKWNLLLLIAVICLVTALFQNACPTNVRKASIKPNTWKQGSNIDIVKLDTSDLIYVGPGDTVTVELDVEYPDEFVSINPRCYFKWVIIDNPQRSPFKFKFGNGKESQWIQDGKNVPFGNTLRRKTFKVKMKHGNATLIVVASMRNDKISIPY